MLGCERSFECRLREYRYRKEYTSERSGIIHQRMSHNCQNGQRDEGRTNSIGDEGTMNTAMWLHEWEYESYDYQEADEADSIMKVRWG